MLSLNPSPLLWNNIYLHSYLKLIVIALIGLGSAIKLLLFEAESQYKDISSFTRHYPGPELASSPAVSVTAVPASYGAL
jgi:hypothetical protein